MKDWFDKLMGKPVPRSNVTPGIMQPEAPPPPVQKQQEEPKEKKAPTLEKGTIVEEDSVLSDLVHAKGFLAKKMGLAKSQVSAKAGEKIAQVKGSSKAMKLIKFIFVVFAVLAVAYLGMTVFKKVQQANAPEEEEVVNTTKETPTPINYSPYKPSVYANDEEILRLEEAVDALEKEISRAVLRDNSLLPPQVDYNISFSK